MVTDRVYHEDMIAVNTRVDRLEDRFNKVTDSIDDRFLSLERMVWKMQVSALISIVSVLISVAGWLWGHPVISLPH